MKGLLNTPARNAMNEGKWQPERFCAVSRTNNGLREVLRNHCRVWRTSVHATPKYATSVILIIFSWSHLKKQLSLKSPYLLKDRASKRNSVINPLLGSFINQGGLTLTTGEELDVNTTPRQTLSQTVKSPIYASKMSSNFLQIIYSSLDCLHLTSPSPVKVAYKISNLTACLGILYFLMTPSPK